MKKTVALVLSVILIFLLSGCGEKQTELSGVFEDTGRVLFDMVEFHNGEFQFCERLEDTDAIVTCTMWGTYSIGDDGKTIYLKSADDCEEKVEVLGGTWTYDASAQVVVYTNPSSGLVVNLFHSEEYAGFDELTDNGEENTNENVGSFQEAFSYLGRTVDDMINNAGDYSAEPYTDAPGASLHFERFPGYSFSYCDATGCQAGYPHSPTDVIYGIFWCDSSCSFLNGLEIGDTQEEIVDKLGDGIELTETYEGDVSGFGRINDRTSISFWIVDGGLSSADIYYSVYSENG